MILRLGFSIAIHADPDILILDEGIIVGDQDFKRRLMIKLKKYSPKAKRLLFVVTWWLYLKIMQSLYLD
jgi:ABC-type polysaccharide/polyol phosphate transport system ATPase subunit